jgi:hypothetical protein
MRVVKSDTGFLFFKKVFKQLVAAQSNIVLWQVSPQSGGRQISHCQINNFNFESNKIFFQFNVNGFLSDSLDLYGYVPDAGFIFKSWIEEIRESSLTIKIPDEIKLLDDQELIQIHGSIGLDLPDIWKLKTMDLGLDEGLSDIWRVKSMAQRSTRDQDLLNEEFSMSLDEEDRLFASQRESPRARPKGDKWVKVDNFSGNGAVLYKLYDLSRGGMGLISSIDANFFKGQDIKILGFNEFELDDPLFGQVMSVRPIDNSQIEFKVGVKFSDGQD